MIPNAYVYTDSLIKTTSTTILMTDTIRQKLLDIEQSENIKICYACESGSRAWGFPSPDSNFDVRFIYTVHLLNDWLTALLEYCKEQVPLLPSLFQKPDELDNLFRKYAK